MNSCNNLNSFWWSDSEWPCTMVYKGAFLLKLTHNWKSSFQTGFGASALVVVSADEPTFKVATTPEESGVKVSWEQVELVRQPVLATDILIGGTPYHSAGGSKSWGTVASWIYFNSSPINQGGLTKTWQRLAYIASVLFHFMNTSTATWDWDCIHGHLAGLVLQL